MDSIYLLWHVHELPNGDDDEKLIGAYRTEGDAKAAIDRVRDQPGFREMPEGFIYERYELNKDHWTEGVRDGLSGFGAKLTNSKVDN